MLDQRFQHPFIPFDVRCSEVGTTRTIVCDGELDLATCPALEAALAAAINEGPETLVVDLGSLAFVDSTGVHALMRAHRHAEARGVRLVIIPAPDRAQEVFAVCGMEAVLPFLPRARTQPA